MYIYIGSIYVHIYRQHMCTYISAARRLKVLADGLETHPDESVCSYRGVCVCVCVCVCVYVRVGTSSVDERMCSSIENIFYRATQYSLTGWNLTRTRVCARIEVCVCVCVCVCTG